MAKRHRIYEMKFSINPADYGHPGKLTNWSALEPDVVGNAKVCMDAYRAWCENKPEGTRSMFRATHCGKLMFCSVIEAEAREIAKEQVNAHKHA